MTGPDGHPTSLVAEEQQLYVARRAPELSRAPSLLRRYAIVGVVIGLAVAGLGFLASAAWRAPFAVVGSLWAVVSGVGGILLLFLWVGTHHIFAYRNENLFHLNPLAVALTVLAPVAVYRSHWRDAAGRAAAAVAAISLLGLALKALPGFNQDNLFLIALVLPGHIALAWALLRLARRADRRATVF